MYINKERLALLMKEEIFQQKVKKQEQNNLNIISGNFQIAMH